MLPTAIRPFLAAILGPILIWAVAKFSQLTGIQYDPQTIQVINDGVVLLIAVSVTKVFLNKKVNPANTASAGLAEKGKTEARQMSVNTEQENR